MLAIWSCPHKGPWLLLRYRPASLWSLKSSQATSSGGKALLVPTPYSIKLALIDAAIQTHGLRAGEELFEVLRGRPIRICPPETAIVSATFVKIWKLARPGDDDESEGVSAAKTFSPSVGFREYVSFDGRHDRELFQVAIASAELKTGQRNLLGRAAAALSYSGKRGGFLQFVPGEDEDGLTTTAELPTNAPYTLPQTVWRKEGLEVPLGSIQLLDELSANARWDHVSTYGVGKVKAGLESFSEGEQMTNSVLDRVFVHTFVPYRLRRTARSYSYYERVDV